MVDWHKSMQQTFEFYKVDPNTWKDVEILNKTIHSCTIDRDTSAETLGSAILNTTDFIPECYVRIYLVVSQNGEVTRHALGTYLIQTPSDSYDGKSHNRSVDAYTPLIELKNNMPPIGYTIMKGEPIMDTAYILTKEHLRAPVVQANDGYKLGIKLLQNFTASPDESWLKYLSSYIAKDDYYFGLDELGRILFEKKVDNASLQPRYIFDDSNSSILYPDIADNRDLYSIPNVVEVIYSNNGQMAYSKVTNTDPNSPTSIQNRGREILHRDTNPNFPSKPTQEQIDAYATQLLRNLSTLEHKLTFTHGYCDVRLGDCILLNYERSGYRNIKARIISQRIKCTTGCPVEETVVYSEKLWG